MENFERRSLHICLSDDHHRAIAHNTSNLAFTVKGKDGVSRIMQYSIPTTIDVTQSMGRMFRRPGKSGLVKSTGRKDITKRSSKPKLTVANRDRPFRFTEVLFTSAPDGEKFYMLITHQKDKCVNYFCTKYVPLARPCFGIHINNMIVYIPKPKYRLNMNFHSVVEMYPNYMITSGIRKKRVLQRDGEGKIQITDIKKLLGLLDSLDYAVSADANSAKSIKGDLFTRPIPSHEGFVGGTTNELCDIPDGPMLTTHKFQGPPPTILNPFIFRPVLVERLTGKTSWSSDKMGFGRGGPVNPRRNVVPRHMANEGEELSWKLCEMELKEITDEIEKERKQAERETTELFDEVKVWFKEIEKEDERRDRMEQVRRDGERIRRIRQEHNERVVRMIIEENTNKSKLLMPYTNNEDTANLEDEID